MTKPPPLLAEEEFRAIADKLRRMADWLPIMSACRVRILAEEIAIEAMRLGDDARTRAPR